MSLVRILPKKGSSLAATKRLWKPTALCMISRRDGSKESISRNALATLRGSMSLKGLKRLGVRMGHKYCAWRPEKVRTNISHLVSWMFLSGSTVFLGHWEVFGHGIFWIFLLNHPNESIDHLSSQNKHRCGIESLAEKKGRAPQSHTCRDERIRNKHQKT